MTVKAAAGASTVAALPPLTKGSQHRRLGVVAGVATIGGLLFGYDTGVINGAERPLQAELALSDLQVGLVISSLAFAAAIGALVCGKLADRFGRKYTIILLSLLFFAGTMLVVFSPGGETYGAFSQAGLATIVVGRALLGFAVGGVSVVVPIYLAELSPYEIRGSLSGRNELMIVVGQMLAFIINAIIAEVVGLNTPGLWRLMFLVSAVPAAALFVGMLRMPESPRWLVERGDDKIALQVLRTVRSRERAVAELAEIKTAVESQRLAQTTRQRPGVAVVLRNPQLLGILGLAAVLGVAQQFTGVNAIMYYGQRLLKESGFSEEMLGWVNIAPGVISVVTGIVALSIMDRIGRRTNFMYGYGLTAVAHIFIAVAMLLLFPEPSLTRGLVFLTLVLLMIGSIQLFLNLATWVYLSEIFPLQWRGLGMGLAVLVLWLANATLGLLVPTLVAAVGMGIFAIFAVINIASWLFVTRFVRETRGKSLEQLEQVAAH